MLSNIMLVVLSVQSGNILVEMIGAIILGLADSLTTFSTIRSSSTVHM
jgi:hypothetical protein